MEFFSSDGVAIAFADFEPTAAGPGDPIFLVHGFASNHMVNWVNTLWVKTLSGAGRRVIALDNRGHGQSQKLYDPAAYSSDIMAQDVKRPIRAKHLEVAVIGRQPLVEDLGHLDRPLVHEQPPGRFLAPMTSVAFDPHLHGTRLRRSEQT